MADSADFIPLTYERPTSEAQHAASRHFLAKMRTRRTVRNFATDPIPHELIRNAIQTAATAPSGANRQPWFFVAISDASMKARIRDAAEAEERQTYERRMSDEFRDAITPLGVNWQKPHLEEAPYLIVVFRQPYGFRTDPDTGETSKFKNYYVDESVGIATGLLLASLHLSGLATLTHTPSPMGFLTEICERPSNERATMIIAVGYPRPDAQVPRLNKKAPDAIMRHFA